MSTIPVIDFSRWRNASTQQERLSTAKEIVQACQNTGAAHIINHGISQSAIDDAFSMSARLFSLSHEEKMQAPHPPGYSIHRGYSYIQQEAASKVAGGDGKLADYKETFEIGSDDNAAQPNQWYPEQTLPGFREWGMKFYWECHAMSQEILTAIAIGIGLKNPQDLLKLHSGHNEQLRLAHYPSAPASVFEDGRTQRCAAHCDFSTMTLLFQDDCGGLEVANPFVDGADFVEATPIKGACVLTIGDILMRWSNDILKSTPHRVGLPKSFQGQSGITGERFSMPYFVSADADAVIKTFPECVSSDRPAKYKDVSWLDYIMSQIASTYDA